MRHRRLLFSATAMTIGLLAVSACSSSDKTSTPTTGGGVTVPSGSGTTINITVGDAKGLDGPMTLVTSAATAKAGNVTFVVKNTGTIDHEVVVLKTATAFDKLPITGFDGEPNRVDEASSVGESGDPAIKPGETRSFTIKNMASGGYALVCNLDKHYGLGMRAPFTVS